MLENFLSQQSPLPKSSARIATWQNLHGASINLAIGYAAELYDAPLLVITKDTATAISLAEELRFFNGPNSAIYLFPDWETLPYDYFSPHQDIISERLLTLYRLNNLTQGIVIVSATTLMQRLPPVAYLKQNSLLLATGDSIDIADFCRKLENSGYRCVTQVLEHGEFAIRGSLIDIFPMGSEAPYRIDLLDCEIDSIRTFDPETQRSLTKITKIHLLPAKEFPLLEESITYFRQTWRAKFNGNPSIATIYQNISQGKSAPGIEYYLPLFFQETATLFDYISPNSLIIQTEDLAHHLEIFWQEIKKRYDELSHDIKRPILPPADIYLTIDQLFGKFKLFKQIQIKNSDNKNAITFNSASLPLLTIDRKAKDPLINLKLFLKNFKGKILFCAESLGRREALIELFYKYSITLETVDNWPEFLQAKNPLTITIAPLINGLLLPRSAIAIITETQLFGEPVIRSSSIKRKMIDNANMLRDLTELSIGALVVHIDHGIGRYLGLMVIKDSDIASEYLTIEYGNQAKLYVPVANLQLVSRYTGANCENVALSRLGSGKWEKTKGKALEKIRDIAAELLDIYAKRATTQGFSFKNPEQEIATFATGFAFEETIDQKKAIADVTRDMLSPKIMDRLICGDVGFGKTEIAMRAAFIAIYNNKQVAVLVPTTLLAEQHLRRFKDRFAAWPTKIMGLSRLQSKAEQEQILQDLATGKIDIIIGTHKLLQPYIKFHKLGLLIIDEEHLFGVRQKDKIKSFRAEVDILTLTATPIPRTLNMALADIRDISIIATPPVKRLAIKTFVRNYDKGLIREAILREILRGGQVYFLHNDIATMEKTAKNLNELIPEANIEVAHGQMSEQVLARVMNNFYHLRCNVLVCTTIIESGLDVPTANTILINRADRFGLAQLHQLRGRVGRSHHQAYAYLLIPAEQEITKDAEKRLEAIAKLDHLGAGFSLASQDLEIRGAGELLGEEQSGNMEAIGFSLYMELLDQAVAALKSGEKPILEKPLSSGVEMDLGISALLPDHYIADVNTRLELYKRIAHAKNQEILDDIQEEIIDRFGILPEATKNLFKIAALKQLAASLGIKKIEGRTQIAKIEFNSQPTFNLDKLIKLIQGYPQQYKLDSSQRLCFTFNSNNYNKINDINNLINSIN